MLNSHFRLTPTLKLRNPILRLILVLIFLIKVNAQLTFSALTIINVYAKIKAKLKLKTMFLFKMRPENRLKLEKFAITKKKTKKKLVSIAVH